MQPEAQRSEPYALASRGLVASKHTRPQVTRRLLAGGVSVDLIEELELMGWPEGELLADMHRQVELVATNSATPSPVRTSPAAPVSGSRPRVLPPPGSPSRGRVPPDSGRYTDRSHPEITRVAFRSCRRSPRRQTLPAIDCARIVAGMVPASGGRNQSARTASREKENVS